MQVALFVTLLWAAKASAPPYIPIAAARQQAQGTTVTVMGLVTVPSGDFSSSSADEGFAIQDQTAGIWVSVPKNPHLGTGSRVEVTGALGTSAGKLQIVATSVKPMPGRALRVATGQIGAATLGYVVTIEGTITQSVVDDLPYGYKLYVDDGTGAAQVYLNKSTDINPRAPYLKTGQRIRVTGFGNQYNSTYEVDPRDRRDLVPLPAK
jgi:DNA/RNA endonuclease YhcR with UshA esterase domain